MKDSWMDRVLLAAYAALAAVCAGLGTTDALAATSGSPCRLVRVVVETSVEVNGETQTTETFVRWDCKQVHECDTEAVCTVTNWPPTTVPNASGDILCWCPGETTGTWYWCDLPNYSWVNDGEGRWSIEKEYTEEHKIEMEGRPPILLECSICSETALCGDPVREEVEEPLAGGGTRTVVHIYCPGCQ